MLDISIKNKRLTLYWIPLSRMSLPTVIIFTSHYMGNKTHIYCLQLCAGREVLFPFSVWETYIKMDLVNVSTLPKDTVIKYQS